MDISSLTARQRSVLEFIIEFQQANHIAPTVREIAAHLGLRSPGGIHRILNVLKEEGCIVADAGAKRAWRLSGDLPGSGIPVVGEIAAGEPIEAIEKVGEYLKVAPGVFGCDRCFGLRVCGDSMIGANIAEGDIAVVRPQATVGNGEIAAVMVEGLLAEATLKIVQKTPTALTLKSANPKYRSMVFRYGGRDRVSILGKYVGLVRRC